MNNGTFVIYLGKIEDSIKNRNENPTAIKFDRINSVLSPAGRVYIACGNRKDFPIDYTKRLSQPVHHIAGRKYMDNGQEKSIVVLKFEQRRCLMTSEFH